MSLLAEIVLLNAFVGIVVCHANSWRLVNQGNCGINRITDRIIGGSEPPIGMYPWLAVFGYRYINETRKAEDDLYWRCGGVLINDRYVFTAAHCISHLPPEFELEAVRLGEHNLKEDPDCVHTNCIGKICQMDCADPVQSFVPVATIPHEEYDIPEYRNDVGLVRLDRKVHFSEWVLPICLPHRGMMSKNYIGTMAEIAGWGLTNPGHTDTSNLLHCVKIKVVHNSHCQIIYPSIAISKTQMCAGGPGERDSCGGDSGGPLMAVHAGKSGVPRYYAIGLVSFGLSECGTPNKQAVYTRVSSFVSWVLSKLSP